MIVRQQGSTTVFVLLATSVLLTAGLGAAMISMGSLARARSDIKASKAFNVAQAALELGMSQTLTKLALSGAIFADDQKSVTAAVQPIGSGCVADWTVLADKADEQSGFITATATCEGVTKSIRARLTAKDLSVWNNAIFGGAGASGRSMNGNVDIRGSVHILGDGESYTDVNANGKYDSPEPFTDKNNNKVWDPGEAFTDTNGDKVWTAGEPFNDVNKNGAYDKPLTSTDLASDLSGTGYVGNNYFGMDTLLATTVPAAPTKNGIQTLSAEFRVRHGEVSLSGNASLGTNSVINSGLAKGTLDGTFVSDGYTGTQGSSAVFSDNGPNNAYDVDSLDMKFPLISGIGAPTYTDATGTVWNTQEDYMNARSLTITDKILTPTGSGFSYGPDQWGNSIKYTPKGIGTAGLLEITGLIKVPDGFQACRKDPTGNRDTIVYRGNGSFWCPGSINIEGNILPDNKIFPTEARLGFIAKDSINIADDSGVANLRAAGAFYAQNRIYSAKQNMIAGTFVSTYFDMGTNVPSIFQVPKLRSNLPPAMPGSRPIIFLKSKSWRERQ